ncbi:hypothetical protein CPC197_0850A, partial [Chlamydia psittaci C1/97]
MSLVNSRH